MRTVTFREKSLAIQIAAILLVYSFFAARYWHQPVATAHIISALIGGTLMMIVITGLAHLAVSIRHRPEATDERDRLVALRGSRNGYVVLAVTIWGVLLLALAKTPPEALFIVILATFTLAELVRLASQLVYYRLGA
jgi:hypothetical protein